MLTTKSTSSSPSSTACGSAKSFGSTPATTSAASSSSDGGDQHLVGVPAGQGRAASRHPRWPGCRPGRRRRRPVGRRAAGWAGSPPRRHRGHRPAGAPRPSGPRCARLSRRHGAQGAGQTGRALADQDHRTGVQLHAGPGLVVAQLVEQRRLGTGHDRDQLGAQLAGPVAEEGRHGPGLQAALAVGLAQPQEDRAGLLLGLEADQQHRGGGLQVGVGHAPAGAGDGVGEEVGLLVGVRPGAEVDVVGAQHGAGELGVGVRVLHGQPAAGEHAGRAGPRPAGRGRRRRSPRATTPAGARRPRGPAGRVSRSSPRPYAKAKRSLSVIHSSLTSGSSPASRRITLPRRWSTRIAEPQASCSATDGVETRSNGRDRNRYAALVSAPTGQIWMVLPEK